MAIETLSLPRFLRSPATLDYEKNLPKVQHLHRRIQQKTCKETVLLQEYLPVFTVGSSSQSKIFAQTLSAPLIVEPRIGHASYYGPGIRIVCAMLNIRERGITPHRYLDFLEEWGLQALQSLGIPVVLQAKYGGLWLLDAKGLHVKVGSVGFCVRRGVSCYGMAIYVRPDLAAFEEIHLCELPPWLRPSSLEKEGFTVTYGALDDALMKTFVTAMCEATEGDERVMLPQDHVRAMSLGEETWEVPRL